MGLPAEPESGFEAPADGPTRQVSAGASPPKIPDTKTIVGVESITEPSAAKPLVPIGGFVGKYQIRSQLGVGGMGAVYLAFDPVIEREVAIKLLTQEVGASNIALQRFLQEARAIGRLNHPNVVSIYDIDLWNGQYYLVMELLSGGSLAQIVEKQGPVPWQDACQMIAQAAGGLAAAHDAGMLHRDIKPENLMQTKDGIVKVVDFGLSKLVDAADDTRTAVTKQGQILGTPHYMSPEQFEAGELDARTDIYSLGASLFRLMTGRFPFHDATTIVQTMMSHLNKPVPLATSFVPNIPTDCNQVIARAMAKRPADRYQSAFEFADDLLQLMQSHRGERVATGAHGMAKSLTTVLTRHSTATIADDFLPLRSVVIVEPSKMLAAMMKDAVTRAGAAQVQVVSTIEQSQQLFLADIPNVLITAMQLPDGSGIDLIKRLSTQNVLKHACIVLNSSDSKIDDLIGSGTAASRVLAPKKVRPDEVLRVIHATGPCHIDHGPIAAPLDPLKIRLVVLTDLKKIPTALADIIRKLALLDVDVRSLADEKPLPQDDVSTVVLRIHVSHRTSGDDQRFTTMAGAESGSKLLFAEVQLDGAHLLIRAIHRQGVTASVCRTLDADRLKCLLEACRST